MPDDVKEIATIEPAGEITPMQMLQIAVDKGADLDQMSKLMDLHERWEGNQARKAYVTALGAFKAEPLTIRKNKNTSFTSRRTGGTTEYDYLTLPEAIRVIAPALSKHGLSHTWSTNQQDGRVAVTCTLTHVLGHSESVTLSGPLDDSGSKNPIQQIASTVTYLERYTLLAITGLSAGDMDDDGGGLAEKVTDDQALEIETRIQDVKADEAKFLAFFDVESVADLPAGKYRQAIDMLEAKRVKQ